MTIKYECDTCGQVVYTAEAVGPKVVVDDTYGKNYDYEDAKTGMALSIRVTSMVNDDHGHEEHFCLACMWKTLRHLMIERSPMVVEPKPVETIREAYERETFEKMEKEYTYVDGVLYKRVVPSEVSSGSPSEHTELSELHAEGQLPETGPDEPADDPGLVTKDGEATPPNVDEGPAHTSWAALRGRGWSHPKRI